MEYRPVSLRFRDWTLLVEVQERFYRGKSHIPPCEVVWLHDDEKACTPDHFYYVCKQNLEKDLEDLPGFRIGKTYDNRTTASDKAQAQDNSAITFHTFEIYAIANCAKAVKIFRVFFCPFEETLGSTGIRFDMEVIANLDLDREAHSDALKHPAEAGILDNASNEISANSEKPISSEGIRISAKNFAQSNPTKEKVIAHSVPKDLFFTEPTRSNTTKTTVTSASSTTPPPAAASKGRPISTPKTIARDPQPQRGSKLAPNCIWNPLREN
ncbi:hypothetical protein BKA65DRAFT_579220 [Rhexocercosporidium sp. MPI-PUGE-AT-0058]|nr:hypothetical protein BKA65DRAFT_579220 [Rhexocercosporidium sp. MPI-PUGE-AT-0058]